MQNSRREDIAFVLLQFWLFGISFMAMTYDSVPHVLAGLGAQQPGSPCSVEMFADYFKARLNYELYNVESFNYMGAPKKIVRIQRDFMAIEVAYSLKHSSSLWLLVYGPISCSIATF
ncbi:hypothetical protein MPER_05219, partial [Moniliophthora perniciosa FA553]